MIWLVLAACRSTSPLPPQAKGATLVRLTDEGLFVEEKRVLSRAQVQAAPEQSALHELKQELSKETGPVWVSAPAAAQWWEVRQLVGSVRESKRSLRGVSSSSSRWSLVGEAPKLDFVGNCDGGKRIEGVEHLINFSIEEDPSNTWVIGRATRAVVVDGTPSTSFQEGCFVQGECSQWFSDQEKLRACERGRVATKGKTPDSVRFAGAYGCLLPLAKEPEQAQAWVTELSALMPVMGLHKKRVLVSPEAEVRFDAVLAVMQGIFLAGGPAPALARPLIAGDDGPPICVEPIRDMKALELAAAYWLGEKHGRRDELGEQGK